MKMAFNNIILVLAALSVGLIVSSTSSPAGLQVHAAAPISSSSICSQVPYPQPCNSLAASYKPAEAGSIDNKTSTLFSFIRDSTIRLSFRQAQQAHRLFSSMDASSFDPQAKLAWSDCLEMSEDTVHQLNRSVGCSSPHSVQTWLSAALTNQQTCANGFADFNLSFDHYLQSFPNNMFADLSKFLSNSLAINKQLLLQATTTTTTSYSAKRQQTRSRRRRLLAHGFPGWLPAADRKLLLLESSNSEQKADVVVAQDGSGNYKTISEAVAASSKRRSGDARFVIYVKAGVYREKIEIGSSMRNLMFVGDGIGATVVTGDRNRGGSTTYDSATFGISEDGFIARDMSFENTAGPEKGQAVAVRCGSDFSVFFRCSFKGYQDTLYVYSKRQFYRLCDIYGTQDFIFGNAAAVFQNCNIYVRKPLSNQDNYVTAQKRSDPNQNTGIVIHNSMVKAAGEGAGSRKTYLGRPWQKYSRTVFMKCFLDDLIAPEGWAEWNGNFGLSTLYYGEYMNSGPGAGTSGRVKWPGYHVITSSTEAGKFTVATFLAGDTWIPATGVPFTSGL
ncbi:pectinesterase-like [Diospyros lotus]|uniref:pectinesterase-like n=1 Tax=Diospyros lotus TaxID=55363 RepID=UPI0022570EC2|nr:pectinesterase-like [Diospyros lotus]